MKAIILAAGYGNRMRPLTDNLHKTLLSVNGKTIIGGIVDGLIDNGVRDLVVVTGYRDKELSGRLSAAYPQLSIQYVHNERYRETNNIYSVPYLLDGDYYFFVQSSNKYFDLIIMRGLYGIFTKYIAVPVDKTNSGICTTDINTDCYIFFCHNSEEIIILAW